MRNPDICLRVSFWVGAIADAVVAAVMFAQAFFGYTSPLNHYVPEIPYRYAMGLAGSLMLGWTILLLWADRRPAERRGVLLITIVVILGLMATGLRAVAVGFIHGSAMAPLIVLQIGLIALFTASYLASRGASRRS